MATNTHPMVLLCKHLALTRETKLTLGSRSKP